MALSAFVGTKYGAMLYILLIQNYVVCDCYLVLHLFEPFLHYFIEGGQKGFDKVVWEVAEQKQGENPSITFKYHSHDGEEGMHYSLSQLS